MPLQKGALSKELVNIKLMLDCGGTFKSLFAIWVLFNDREQTQELVMLFRCFFLLDVVKIYAQSL